MGAHQDAEQRLDPTAFLFESLGKASYSVKRFIPQSSSRDAREELEYEALDGSRYA